MQWLCCLACTTSQTIAVPSEQRTCSPSMCKQQVQGPAGFARVPQHSGTVLCVSSCAEWHVFDADTCQGLEEARCCDAQLQMGYQLSPDRDA